MRSIIPARGGLASTEMTDLTTSSLRLRQWRAADLEHFAALNADPLVMEFMPRCLSRAGELTFELSKPEACEPNHGTSRITIIAKVCYS
jgi:RimJ/RimL family protein N-acetyltransferase